MNYDSDKNIEKAKRSKLDVNKNDMDMDKSVVKVKTLEYDDDKVVKFKTAKFDEENWVIKKTGKER